MSLSDLFSTRKNEKDKKKKDAKDKDPKDGKEEAVPKLSALPSPEGGPVKRSWKQHHEKFVREGSIRTPRSDESEMATEASVSESVSVSASVSVASPASPALPSPRTPVSNPSLRSLEQLAKTPDSGYRSWKVKQTVTNPRPGLSRTNLSSTDLPPLESSPEAQTPTGGLSSMSPMHSLGEVPIIPETPSTSVDLALTKPKRIAMTKTNKHVRNESAVNIEKQEIKSGPEIDKRRELIVNELLSTEKVYVNTLRKLVENYAVPIVKYCTANKKNIAPAFLENAIPLLNNVQTILNLNENFLTDLEGVIGSWNNTQTLGGTLLKFLPFLKLYSDYANNYDGALRAIEEVCTLPWFETYYSSRLEFESFLITPIQRIPRYSLLLQDLWNHTSIDHPDNTPLSTAISTCKNVAEHVNRAITLARNSEHLAILGLGHLLEPHRRLVLEGTLLMDAVHNYYVGKQKKVKKEYQFFLFNDLLVFMKVRKEFKSPSSSQTVTKVNSKTLKVKQVWDNELDTAWPLELVWLKPTDEKAFEIIGPMKTISVKGKEKEITQWYKTISDNIKNVLILTQSAEKIQDDAAEKLIKRTGKFTMHSGEVYEGEWNLGRMQGYGISEFQGTCYEGSWLLNMKNGLGKMEFSDGQIYVGEFSNGKPHGTGTSLTLAGDKYQGGWVSGKREGNGELVFANGDSYTGEWKNNNIEGHGTLSLKSMKVTYSGNFVGGKYHGSGTLTSTLGVFEGTFEHGRQTYGKLEYDNHDFYEGQFKLGLKHGEGKMISQDGIYNGQWVKDLKEGKGSMIYCDGSSYEGNWSLGMRHGKGTWTNSNKGFIASYNGDWVYDTREGSGEIVYNTGDKYVGAIVAGQPHGNGKMILASGVVLEGKFVNGVMEGKVDILNPEKAVVSVLENGQMVGETEGVEILVPPFLPVLQF